MPKLTIDIEKLTYGLEVGIGKTETIYASVEPQTRLRITPCGLVSSAIHATALREGIASRLVISNPKLPFDEEMQHVVPLVGEEERAVDASPSQFLKYVGITRTYEVETGETVLPPEKILTFGLEERRVIIDWLTKAAIKFQRERKIVEWRWGVLGDGPLANATETELRAQYDEIWNPKNLSTWQPPARVLRDGRMASASIPRDAITLS